FDRRPVAGAEDPALAWLPGAFRREGEKGKRHHHDDGRPHRRLYAGGRNPRLRQGGPYLPRARSPVGPALGMACGGRARRRGALCTEDDGGASQAAAAALPETGAADRLKTVIQRKERTLRGSARRAERFSVTGSAFHFPDKLRKRRELRLDRVLGRLVMERQRVLVELGLCIADENLRRAEDIGAEKRHRHAPVILH